MNIDYSNIYNNFDLGFSFAGGLVKILVGLLLFSILFYSFMLLLKIRVLQDTIDISESTISKIVITFNLIITLGGSILAFILILL